MKKSFFLVDCDGANRQDSSSGQGSIRKLNIVTCRVTIAFPSNCSRTRFAKAARAICHIRIARTNRTLTIMVMAPIRMILLQMLSLATRSTLKSTLIEFGA